MATKSGNGGLILLAVAGAAAYYAYTQGWLSSLFGAATPAAVTSPASPGPSISAPAAASSPTQASNFSAVPIPLQQTLLTLNPTTNPAPTAAQIAAAETGTGVAALLAKSMAASGSTQAQIDAAVSNLLQSQGTNPAGSIAGIGRVVVIDPRRGGYHWRRRA